MQMNQIDSITPLDFTSMKDLFDYIHQSTQASDMLISKIEYLIMKISEQQSSFNTPSTSTTHSSSDSLLSPLINSKDLSELRSNIKQFSFAFFNNITIKPKSPAAYRQVRAMIDFFNSLKSRQMLIPDIPHRGISDIFNIIPSFLIDFLNIFEYSDILSNITQLASHLNTIIAKRKITLNSSLTYIVFFGLFMSLNGAFCFLNLLLTYLILRIWSKWQMHRHHILALVILLIPSIGAIAMQF